MSEDRKKIRRFVVGDLHGNYKGLKQVLEKVSFDYDNDILISLGDIADGYSQVPEIIEEFMKMKHLTWCLGNHDEWVQNWMSGKMDMKGVNRDGRYNPVAGWDRNEGHATGIHPDTHLWLSQGGRATYVAYIRTELISKHRDFWLNKPVLYHIIDDDKAHESYCFVHAGWDRTRFIADEAKRVPYFLYWDRNFWNKAMSAGDTKLSTEDHFDKVFIGHTSTNFWGEMKPMYKGGVWNLDTGAGWHGVVTLMNIDTEEYVQSDLATELYSDEKPRK